MIEKLLSPIARIGEKVIDKIAPDAGMAEQLKAAFTNELLAVGVEELKQSAAVIIAEAKGGWLQRNWRPMLMTAFGAIIVNNYILAPYLQAMFSFSVNLEIPPDMWDLLKIGIGGYIVGRSTEKAVEAWKGGA